MNVQALANKSQAELLAIIAAMQAPSKLSMKVSKGGGLSVYGNGRYPTTLFIQGWERLIELVKSGQLEAFIEANRPLFSTGKNDARFVKAED